MEWWNIGEMEWWNNGKLEGKSQSMRDKGAIAHPYYHRSTIGNKAKKHLTQKKY